MTSAESNQSAMGSTDRAFEVGGVMEMASMPLRNNDGKDQMINVKEMYIETSINNKNC